MTDPIDTSGAADTIETLPRDASGVWEITTVNGTRHVLDLDSGVSMRLPAVHESGHFAGRANDLPGDSQWNLMRFVGQVTTGARLAYGASMHDGTLTTEVVSIRRLSEEEIPPPPVAEVHPTLPFLPAADDEMAYTATLAGYSGGGPTPTAAIEDLARGMEPDLDNLDEVRWGLYWGAQAANVTGLPADADRATRLGAYLVSVADTDLDE